MIRFTGKIIFSHKNVQMEQSGIRNDFAWDICLLVESVDLTSWSIMINLIVKQTKNDKFLVTTLSHLYDKRENNHEIHR